MRRMRTEGFDVLHLAEQLAFAAGQAGVGTAALLVAALRTDLDLARALQGAGIEPGEVERTARDVGTGSEELPASTARASVLARIRRPALPMTIEASACIEGVGILTEGDAGVEHIAISLVAGPGVAAELARAHENFPGEAEAAVRALADARAQSRPRRRLLFGTRRT